MLTPLDHDDIIFLARLLGNHAILHAFDTEDEMAMVRVLRRLLDYAERTCGLDRLEPLPLVQSRVAPVSRLLFCLSPVEMQHEDA